MIAAELVAPDAGGNVATVCITVEVGCRRSSRPVRRGHLLSLHTPRVCKRVRQCDLMWRTTARPITSWCDSSLAIKPRWDRLTCAAPGLQSKPGSCLRARSGSRR